MKKVISILVSVMMILTAIPAFADTAAAAPASVDIYDALDNFSDAQKDTLYTASAPYTTECGFKAPTTNAYDTTLVEDNERAYVHMEVVSKQNPNGGAIIYDEDVLVKSDASFEYSVTFRYSGAQTELFWYFIDPNGTRIAVNESYPLRIWGNAGEYALYSYGLRGYPVNRTVNLLNDVWYTVSISMDFANQKVSGVVNGGAYENFNWSGNMSSTYLTNFTNNIENTYGGISGIGIGYLNTVNEGVTLDVADISFSTEIKTDASDELTFAEPSIDAAISSTASWTNGKWSSNFSNYAGTVALENTDGAHGKSLKYTKDGGNLDLSYTFDKAIENSEGNSFIVEFSYKSHSNGQPRMVMHGAKTDGSSGRWYKLIDHPNTSGSTANLFGNSGLTGTTPIDGQWHRIRLEFDMKKDVITFSRWAENDPQNVEIVADSTGQLALFSSISTILFYSYQKTWGQDRYMYLDDLRVYKPDTLRYIGSNPAKVEGFSVSEEVNPSILFNMPIASTTATTDNVYLLDSEGNRVNGTVGLSAQRNGVSFYPAKALDSDEAYTLVANCTVTDEFGSTLAVNKTVKFETSLLLNMVDFKFMQNGEEVEAIANGTLNTQIELKSRANEYRNIYAALAIYNKSTGELVSINTGSINAVTNTFNLTAEVPAEGTYYAKAFVWNTDANAVPYFTAQSIGLN